MLTFKELLEKNASPVVSEREKQDKSTNEEVEQINELSPELLQRYKEKAKQSIETLKSQKKYRKMNDRWMAHMKATGKQIEKTTETLRKARGG